MALPKQSLIATAIAGVGPTVAPPVVTWKDLRTFADRAAAARGEWGGAPIPMDHVRLVMEPRYPFQGLNRIRFGKDESKDDGPVDYVLLNTWHSRERGVQVYVCREANGRSRCYFDGVGAGRRLDFLLNTLGVAAGHAWDESVERRALEKLKSLVSDHAYHCYMLTGTFLETSKRSGVTYLFRKLRPTVALGSDPDGLTKRFLAALCLHPLGYYEQTWAGVMCPTDDVVAHLMMMRADEHHYWKKANQHGMSGPNAGI